jgi:hypothetical protein
MHGASTSEDLGRRSQWRRPKLQPPVYRAANEAHANGMEMLAHLSRTSALADAKDLQAGVDGFVHLVRDRDVDEGISPR